jgi:hypothetical protein
LNGSLNRPIAVGISDSGIVDGRPESATSMSGDLARDIHDGRFLIFLGDDSIIFEADCLQVFADLVDCPLL